MSGGWGKAGVRLTPKEQERRRRAVVAKRAATARSREADNRVAKTRWRAGLVIPAVITMALDAKSLYGPEVDKACGVEEPTVDLWEAGKVYPTWEQLVALAELVGVTPRFLTEPKPTIHPDATSLRFHVAEWDPPPPDLRFEPAAVRAVVGEYDPKEYR